MLLDILIVAIVICEKQNSRSSEVEVEVEVEVLAVISRVAHQASPSSVTWDDVSNPLFLKKGSKANVDYFPSLVTEFI
jgi:hypothetical protein